MVSFHRLNICAFTAGQREDPASANPKRNILPELENAGRCGDRFIINHVESLIGESKWH
jgi:hypothetical protein